MKSWKLNKPFELDFVDSESQSVREGCVKIKLRYSAISLSDIFLFDGTANFDEPVVLGRQGIGMVTEVGEDVKNLSRGDIVAIKPFRACGGCYECNADRPSDCENKLIYGQDKDGFLRDFAVVNAEDVYKLPERIDLKDALFLEHIDMAISAVGQLSIEKGDFIVITGATHLGLIMAQVVAYYQAIPIIVDVDTERLKAAGKFAYYVINCSSEDVKQRILMLTGGRMSNAVVHIGDGEFPFNQSLLLVKNKGKVVIVGWENTANLSGINAIPVMEKQLEVVGIMGSSNNFPAAINMLANETVKVDFGVPEIKFVDADTLLEKPADAHRFIVSRVVMD